MIKINKIVQAFSLLFIGIALNQSASAESSVTTLPINPSGVDLAALAEFVNQSPDLTRNNTVLATVELESGKVGSVSVVPKVMVTAVPANVAPVQSQIDCPVTATTQEIP